MTMIVIIICINIIVFLIREHFDKQFTITSEIRPWHFEVILTPLSRRKKDNDGVSSSNSNKGDRVC